MSLNKYSEVEVLKEELNFLTDLLQEHKNRGAYYQKPQFCSVPYGHSSVYNRQNSVKSTNRSSLSTYKSKYHANRTSFKNQFNDKTGKIMSRGFTQKPTPISVFPKQNISYGAKQDSVWKYNQAPSCTQNLSNSTFKIVRTSSSAKAANMNSETRAVTNSAKVVAGSSISTLGNTHSSEFGVKNTKGAQTSNFLKPISENNNLQPLEKNVANKHPKGAKVSYVTCSDCIIEISEYENGELHISQKKLDPSVQDDDESTLTGNSPSPVKLPKFPSPVKLPKSPSPVKLPKFPSPVKLPKSPSPVKIPKSSWSGIVCEKDSAKGLSAYADNQHTSELNFVYQKQFTGSDSSTAKSTVISNSMESDIKLSNVSSQSQRQNSSSLCKFTKSQHPCVSNAKYSKVNVGTSKSQNSVAKLILKNKYSVKKSNVKCKVNKELKGCIPHHLKYTHASKPTSHKCLVNYSSKKTALLPVRNLNKRTVHTSYNNFNLLRQNHTKGKVTKSSFPPQSCAKISRKAKALHLQNVYKVVNKPNAVASKVLKCSKVLSKSNPSSLVLRNGDHSSDKKWFKLSNDSARSSAHCSSNTGSEQNQSNIVVKSETKKILPSSASCKTSSCELAGVRNTPKIISQHSLQRIVQKKSSIKKSSLNPSPKSFLDGHLAIKKAKKVSLSRTTYKVVNRYANHVSQVVQMIKTKYRTVNKRSASNSHLKWLQEQKRAYLSRKVPKSLHSHAKTGWVYNSPVQHRTRKHPVLHRKAPRKRLSEQNILKNIRGVTYKVSKTQMKKSFTPKRMKRSRFTLRNGKNSVIVNVHGTKFQMSPGGKSLKRLRINKEGSKTSLGRIKIGGFTYVQQKEGSSCLVKSSSTTQNVASRMLHRSINTVRAAEAKKTLRKNNIFCMFFNRFGRCNKEGNCPYIHDPSKIAVCTRFLRGTCKNSRCPFSHEISPGKMAICSFFLQGNCTNSNCPYRHTSIKPGTKPCKAFLKGYCNKGSECQDAHILACPHFICEGFCENESCMWPHPPMKNNVKKRSDPPEVGREIKEIKEKDAAADDISDQRYFTYEPGVVSDKCIKLAESVQESIQTQTNEKITKVRNKKIVLPKQPEFIPLFVSDEEL